MLGLTVSSSAIAAPIQFTLDPTQSSLDISVASLFGPSEPQGPGAWSASYSGSIDVDVTGTTIQFLDTTSLTAGISGQWVPGEDYSDYVQDETGSDYQTIPVDANYGNTTTIVADGRIAKTATRDLQLSLSSAALPLLPDGSFVEDGITPAYLSGIVYYDTGLSPPITDLTADGVTITPFAGASGTGSLTQVGDVLTLSVPVQFTTSFFLSTTTYTGMLVGTAVVVPEPAGVTLLMGALPALLLKRRRTRSL